MPVVSHIASKPPKKLRRVGLAALSAMVTVLLVGGWVMVAQTVPHEASAQPIPQTIKRIPPEPTLAADRQPQVRTHAVSDDALK